MPSGPACTITTSSSVAEPLSGSIGSRPPPGTGEAPVNRTGTSISDAVSPRRATTGPKTGIETIREPFTWVASGPMSAAATGVDGSMLRSARRPVTAWQACASGVPGVGV